MGAIGSKRLRSQSKEPVSKTVHLSTSRNLVILPVASTGTFLQSCFCVRKSTLPEALSLLGVHGTLAKSELQYGSKMSRWHIDVVALQDVDQLGVGTRVM